MDPKISFSGGERGWIGDNPFVFLDTERIRSLGWKQQYSIKKSVENTVDYLQENDWIFEFRK